MTTSSARDFATLAGALEGLGVLRPLPAEAAGLAAADVPQPAAR